MKEKWYSQKNGKLLGNHRKQQIKSGDEGQIMDYLSLYTIDEQRNLKMWRMGQGDSSKG